MLQNTLFENAEFFKNFTNYTVTGICVFQFDSSINDYRLVLCNKAFYTHNSYIKQDVTHQPFKVIFPHSTQNGMFDKVSAVDKTGQPVQFTLSYQNKTRGLVCQMFQIFKLSDTHVVSMFNDISDIKKSENMIRLEKIKYSQTLHSLSVGVITTDSHKNITLINRQAILTLSLENPDEVYGQSVDDLYHIEKTHSNDLMHELVDGFDVQTIVCKNGVKKLVVHRITTLFDDAGNSHGYVYSFDDVSTFVKTQEELMFLNYHDMQTKFYNRHFLKVFLANNSLRKDMGVIFADINGLSRVNDTLGSEVGDRVLEQCAKAFTSNLSENTLFVRFGEDDFLALVNISPEINLSDIAAKIRHDFDEACKFANTTISVGSSVVGLDAQSLKDAIRLAQDKMNSQKIMNMQSIRSSALLSLLATLQVKSHETEEHAQRLNTISHTFARKLNLNEKELNQLALLSVLHDVGKIGVPEFVLDKPGKLTEEEWKIMKNHSLLGYQIMQSTPEMEEVSVLVRAHHERWDGKGYPDGLQGENIPLLSRIISLVDTYDAMVNDRVYRKALSLDEAISEIQNNSGTQFDPALVPLFIQTLKEIHSSTDIHDEKIPVLPAP